MLIRCRFIPARAGNTMKKRNEFQLLPVYPRSRGEHPGADGRIPAARGLSPLARGTQRFYILSHGAERFIPARAGNTRQSRLDLPDDAVYPRSRGEHDKNRNPRQPVHGLSPLARGTRKSGTGYSPGYRFIPARAGNTMTGSPLPERSSVYPRSRGEHTLKSRAIARVFGLSPLARGTLPSACLLLI